MDTNHCSGARTLIAVLVAAILALLPLPAAAQPPTLASVGATPPATARPGRPTLSGQVNVDWKVVYVVGYVNSSTDWAPQARSEADELRAMGMTVVTFVPGANAWADIVAAAADADVLIYAGHGVSWGGDPQTVGGMSLNSGQFVSPDQIRQQLRMAPNAIVILNHVCFASGGSTTDPGPISSAEAQRRVAQYAGPFLDAGAVGYYSDWYTGFPVDILTYLAGGMTLGDAYEAYQDYNSTSVERYAHPSHTEYAMWLDWGTWSGSKMYDYAFVGDEDLSPLHPPSSAQPLAIGWPSLTVRMEPGAGTSTYSYPVTSGGVTVTWTASIDGNPSWVRVTPASGQSGAPLTLSFIAPAQPGTYQATLRLHTGDASVSPSDTLIPITLVVARPDPYEVRLPSVYG